MQNVPDMPDPGPGSQTFYYTNQQSARLLFYHDHAWGITRLNVYVGEAAGYLIQDPVEQAMVNGGTVNGRTFTAGTIPADQIPLIIQDKTFVDPATITEYRPDLGLGFNRQPCTGSHGIRTGHDPVPATSGGPMSTCLPRTLDNPDLSGANAYGPLALRPLVLPADPGMRLPPGRGKTVIASRLDRFRIPITTPTAFRIPTLVENNNFCQPPEMPGTPNVSWGAEAFLDTMLVNGTVYPKVTLDPKPYRFRILNASHDRFLNLQLYLADPTVSPVNPAMCRTCAPNTEVKMVPAAANRGFPGRTGRRTAGKAVCLIRPQEVPPGSRSAPKAASCRGRSLLPNQPVTWNTDPTMFNVGNVLQQNRRRRNAHPGSG